MPVAKGNPLPELKKAIKYYIDKTGKRVTLEVALLSGVNTTSNSAKRLIDFAKDLDVYINVIPWNPVENLDFNTPSYKECKVFMDMLENANVLAGLRLKRGSGISGACGQLGQV